MAAQEYETYTLEITDQALQKSQGNLERNQASKLGLLKPQGFELTPETLSNRNQTTLENRNSSRNQSVDLKMALTSASRQQNFDSYGLTKSD